MIKILLDEASEEDSKENQQSKKSNIQLSEAFVEMKSPAFLQSLSKCFLFTYSVVTATVKPRYLEFQGKS